MIEPIQQECWKCESKTFEVYAGKNELDDSGGLALVCSSCGDQLGAFELSPESWEMVMVAEKENIKMQLEK